MATVTYAGHNVTLQDGITAEDVKKQLAQLYPELENAQIVETPNGNFELIVQAGTKGI